MLKSIAIVLALAVAALLIYAATRPDTFAVQRSATIHATPERLHALISDLQQFNTWNPYAKKDLQMQITYRGPASGAGAAFDFKGNSNAGTGSISIVDSQPAKITMTLDMTAPMPCHNTIEYTLKSQGEQTEVTWAMHGPNPFLGKLVGVIFNMDRMVGQDFEAGLASLKALAERT